MFSFSWSGQSGVSLSVDNAQARRLYISRYPLSPYRADLSGLPWYAVRAYYAGGPWCGVVPGGSYARPLGSLGVNPGPATATGVTINRSMALVAIPVPWSRAG